MRVIAKALRIAAIQILILLATFFVIDVVVYKALPEDMASNFPTYRIGAFVPDFFGRGYPHDYYEAVEDRGFDIKPTPVPRTDQFHWVENIRYPVWSNALGCFDTPHPSPQPGYYYFAGDSLLWGYAPFETKFGTIFEKLTGIETFKCGVTHTGQLHEFAKFREIMDKVGRWPARVVVFYSATDVMNDYAHPHSTVIDGGLADLVRLDGDNNIVKLDAAWFAKTRAKIAKWREQMAGKPADFVLSEFLMKYSISAQILNGAIYALKARLPAALGNRIPVLGDEPMLAWADKYELYEGKKLYDIHRLTYLESRNNVFRYTDYKYAARNKDVITRWGEHARAHGYKLEFVLLPAGESFVPFEDDPAIDFYRELKAFLASRGIKYYDMDEELRRRKIPISSLYWETNVHFSINGNFIVGNILAQILK